VGRIAKIVIETTPRYFPTKIDLVEIGRLFKISYVPCLYSSEKLRMVIAGIKRIKIHGAKSKYTCKLVYPKSNTLKLGSTNNNSPFTSK
jgi:hypothetical protein